MAGGCPHPPGSARGETAAGDSRPSASGSGRGVHVTKRSLHGTIDSVHETKHSIHGTKESVHETKHSVHVPSHSVHVTNDSVHDTEHSVQETKHSVHETRGSVHVRNLPRGEPAAVSVRSGRSYLTRRKIASIRQVSTDCARSILPSAEHLFDGWDGLARGWASADG
jgi:hypothetical protein